MAPVPAEGLGENPAGGIENHELRVNGDVASVTASAMHTRGDPAVSELHHAPGLYLDAPSSILRRLSGDGAALHHEGIHWGVFSDRDVTSDTRAGAFRRDGRTI